MPSYGPLWFVAFKLDEILHLDHTPRITKALAHLSSELIWKLWIEIAQLNERQGNIKETLLNYVNAIQSCSINLHWKIWLQGAKTELKRGNNEVASKLLRKSLETVPHKMQPIVLRFIK